MTDDKLDDLADQLMAEASGMAAEGSAAPKKETNGLSGAKDRNLNLILDIPLKVTVELGRTKMPVSELLNLTQGSVIELNKLAGEPMEVYVNDKLIARGEAVVVNEKFGVRLTDIISPAERVEQLK
ncbi:flagellar motor switch protein FliN [Bdellovibrio sp. SKB1291214]|uniref:flagellar motor switch protein FliN n=1 Tax=Bdellovibrio sp. SKB1291214 TaxID=1732569 RepID=UPI00223F38EE|nr:flagellar motor switch protein FliN [Bdellovibrio sp. SKB1291214]UYL09194.1 flagellar motor switch protein FliN [Bdellovibrio sp. SKB1291214]